ncbi:tRNA pseudouridine(55) synthase TruB [Candidatus Gracilibacteria bacterium]|nr:tRNA pseudouridine(55) synthase TruB [Candidatus Gracilibacteria bacterium]
MDGFWLIDKERGWTSFDVCAKLRKILNVKKIGHTGTLDPFATGLLLVATGKCTKLIPFLEKERKTYRTTILLGQTSSTLDTESEVTKDETFLKKFGSQIPGSGMPLNPGSKETLREFIEQNLCSIFQGKIQQVPPQFSAIKIAGKKSCDIARKGGTVELKPRETEILSSKILSYEFPRVEIELEVAAGFYVRAFARDLAQSLGTVGMCESLRRIKIGDLSVEDAHTLDKVSMPIDPKYILKNLDQREIPTGRVQDFIEGRAFDMAGVGGDKILVLVGGNTLGVGEIVHGKLQPRIVL